MDKKEYHQEFCKRMTAKYGEDWDVDDFYDDPSTDFLLPIKDKNQSSVLDMTLKGLCSLINSQIMFRAILNFAVEFAIGFFATAASMLLGSFVAV